MNEQIATVFGVIVTPWKIIGWLGVFMFSARWAVQFYASSKHRRVMMPRMFWYLSIIGSLMCLAYFIFGKNDSVGILSYMFPFAVAIYNLYLDLTHKKRFGEEASGNGSAG